MSPEDLACEEEFVESLHEEWYNSEKSLDADDLAWIQANRPNLLVEWEAEWVRDNRPPTRQEIVQKMNFHADGFGDDDFERGMDAGIREMLGEALTLPRDTDYQG